MGAKITPEVDGAYGRYKDEFIKYLEDKYQRKFLPIALYPEMEFLEFRAYPEGGDNPLLVGKDLIDKRIKWGFEDAKKYIKW